LAETEASSGLAACAGSDYAWSLYWWSRRRNCLVDFLDSGTNYCAHSARAQQGTKKMNVTTYRYISDINNQITVRSVTMSVTAVVKLFGNLTGFRILCVSDWSKNTPKLES
jgi:hypothetical protein